MTRPVHNAEAAGLDPEEQFALEELLDEFSDVFSQDPTDIGRARVCEYTIDLTEGAKEFREAPRRMTPERHLKADQQVQILLEMGLIEPSRSSFASGIVMVKKPNGEDRFCVDYRKLNDITQKDAFPLPNITDTIDSIGNAKYFSSMDMGSAFWQIPIEEKSRPYTAFVVPGGFYQWKFMPFGLCNAPAAFQRLMANVLAPIAKRYGNLVLCYIDDILIATQTIGQHLERLREVFTCIRAAGLKFKAAKCQLFQKEVKFLGRLITKDGLVIDPAGIEKVQSWARPRNRTELKSFLGFANYYRDFVKNFSDIVSPLTALDRKWIEFEWNEDAEYAFEELKQAFTTAPVLALPSDEGLYVLDTDASAVAIAGILHQIQETENGDFKTRVISYGSRSLHGS
ncbi:MAG: hypothetical protein GY819_19605, partial [Planctomycetaceae bacterium]|nr:hypothetical protein [Planctomycetaceae bacterium]